MKNLLKLSLVLTVLLTTLTVHANDHDFLLYVKNKNGKQITFSINGIQQASIAIYDLEGTKIYSENANGNKGIIKTYDLIEFPEGSYILKVENEFKKATYEIVITEETATLSSKGLSENYKQVTDGKLKLASK